MKKKLWNYGKVGLTLSVLLLSTIGHAQINTFPHVEDFEANDGGWVASGTNSSWEHGVPAGPYISGSVGCGSNAWVTNLTGDYSNNENSQIESPVYDFTALTSDPILKFDHIFETEGCCDEGWVEFSIDGGTIWTKLGTSASGISNWYNDAGNNWWDGTSGIAGEWRSASHVLTGLAGEGNVQLRFKVSTDGSVTRDGFGIDNIIVHDGLFDVSLDALAQPVSTSGAFTASEVISVNYTNNGSLPAATVQLCYTIDGGAPVCETFSPGLASGASATQAFTALADLSAPGTHNISIYYSDVNEDYLCNDTLNVTVTTIVMVNSFPYIEDFEAGDGDFLASGTSSSWEYGVPSGPFIDGTVGCGNNAWVTNLAGDYNNNENSQVESVPFDFSGMATDPILRFDHIFETESCCDEGWVEYTIDGGATWIKLGTAGSGTNWYNDAGNIWWDGTSGNAGDWRTATHVLTGLAGESSVKLRWKLSTDGSVSRDGFGVDNIMIYEDMEIADLSPIAIVSPIDGCSLSATEAISVDVMNNGSDSTSTVDICYSVDGGAVVCETVAIVIAPDSTETVNLVGTIDASVAGTYSIEIVSAHTADFRACNDTLVASVTNTVLASSDSVTDVTCNGLSDGAITVNVTGGTGPFDFDWSNGDSLNIISSLSPDTYGVLITDSTSGCTDSLTLIVTEPAALASSTTATDVNCNGGTDGEVDLTITGGTSPYTFDWDNNETTEDISGLIAGTYEVIIMDSLGCSDTISETVAEPTALVLSGTVVNETLGNDGSIDLTVSGATPSYTFSWDNGAGTDEDPSGLLGNTTYTVTVTDTNGCSDTMSFFVSSSVGISTIENSLIVNAYPNPNNGHFVVELDEALEGTIEVFSLTGQLVNSQELNNQKMIDFDLSHLESGIYTLNVMTATGKTTLRMIIQ